MTRRIHLQHFDVSTYSAVQNDYILAEGFLDINELERAANSAMEERGTQDVSRFGKVYIYERRCIGIM